MQSYAAIEIILIDDGSRDKSGLLCGRMQHIDNRIVVKHQPNRGVHQLEMKALRLVQANIFFLLMLMTGLAQ